jgi:RsiW-degrading membrane proteinase PrsW (M82 family)
MSGTSDPGPDTDTEAVEAVADEGRDLYDVATWEERTLLDTAAVKLYHLLRVGARIITILAALAILVALVLLGGLGVVYERPLVGGLALLSAVPALGLAAYVWWADSTTSEPLSMLVATFLLGVLFANFAAVVNSLTQSLFTLVPAVGMILFFYLIVAPVEEAVKLLAVRLHAYRQDTFDAVVDGAVYGAMAGLGFATIENALYVSRGYLEASGAGVGGTGAGEATIFGMVAGTAAVRALAGPGHVIYSAFAGYYLGLAKFNEENWGPIVVKGLLIATLIHATYNSISGVAGGFLAASLGIAPVLGTFLFIVVYDGVFAALLVRKLRRYRAAFEAATPDEHASAEEVVDANREADVWMDGDADDTDRIGGRTRAESETGGARESADREETTADGAGRDRDT